MSMAMEFDVPVMDSQWEYTDYEPNNIHIYEKEFHDYVVYYVARDSRLFSGGSQHTSGTGIWTMWEKCVQDIRDIMRYAFLYRVK